MYRENSIHSTVYSYFSDKNISSYRYYKNQNLDNKHLRP